MTRLCSSPISAAAPAISLVRLQANSSGMDLAQNPVIGTDGVGIAGDSFDSKLVRNLVAPMLGLGSRYQSQFGKILPVPNWLYEHLERWHYLSFLKTRKNMELLRQIEFQAVEPQKIKALIDIVDHDLGYRLYQSIERTKCALSNDNQAKLLFAELNVMIEQPVTRKTFRGLDRAPSPADRRLRGPLVGKLQSQTTRRRCGLYDRRFILRSRYQNAFRAKIWRGDADSRRARIHFSRPRPGDPCRAIIRSRVSGIVDL